MKRSLLALAILVLCSLPASAATCYWVGGSATWDPSVNTASWASSTGGTPSSCGATGGIPGSTGPDTAIFDGSSGGGTVTVNINANLAGITSSAFTGTLDFSANTNTFTLSNTNVWADAGTGTHTIKLGADTFNITCTGGNFATCWNWSGSGTTLTAGTSTLNFTETGACTGGSQAGSGAYNFNSKTYANVTITGAACAYAVNGNNTFASLTLNGPVSLLFGLSAQTITTAFNWTGTASNVVFITCGGNGACAISAASGSHGTWIAMLGVKFTSNTPSFTNCIGNNISGVSCTAPSITSAGSGTGVIGGGI